MEKYFSSHVVDLLLGQMKMEIWTQVRRLEKWENKVSIFQFMNYVKFLVFDGINKKSFHTSINFSIQQQLLTS